MSMNPRRPKATPRSIKQALPSETETGASIGLESELQRPIITFHCDPVDVGVIAPPLPAVKAMPSWFRSLAAIDRDTLSATDNAMTIKRCMPFLDALSAGWVLPLAATVRLEVTNDGGQVDCGWDFDRTMISNHSPQQVAGHPRLPSPPMKFHNHWTIVTPPGWSCLFVSPLNHPHPAFDVLAGIVDTDEYRSQIHFPFFPPATDGIYTIEAGTPVVQIIPFRRDASALAMTADIRAATPEEAAERERIRRSTMAREGWYRTDARAPR